MRHPVSAELASGIGVRSYLPAGAQLVHEAVAGKEHEDAIRDDLACRQHHLQD